ncbi:MAG: NnrS family protein [Pseudomonadota bacterium]
MRFAAGLLPDLAQPIYMISGLMWFAAFLGFVAIYGPMLLKPKLQG